MGNRMDGGLDAFIISNRDRILARARSRVASRPAPKASKDELTNGIPVFLDQLGAALRLAKVSAPIDHEEIGKSATRHGHDLLLLGLTIGQVVHDYGDVCQSIAELAVDQDAQITSIEFQTLNLCLDDAIAGAVTEYARQRELEITDQGTERLGRLAHEARNLLNTALLAFEAIKSGHVGPLGSTSLVLHRSLMGMRTLVDRSLAEVRLDAGVEHREPITVAEFLEEVEIGALMQAHAQSVALEVGRVDRSVVVEGDRQILAAALANLLENAFKFSRKHGHIGLLTRITADRVLFDVEDECGGLPPGKVEELFAPFEQRGSDRTGLGLGLAIAFKAAEAHAGAIHVRDIPGKGCVFTLDLPRLHSLAI